MVIKVKEYFNKTRQVKNYDRSKKYVLRGQRNSRYHEKVLSNKKKTVVNDYDIRLGYGIRNEKRRIIYLIIFYF